MIRSIAPISTFLVCERAMFSWLKSYFRKPFSFTVFSLLILCNLATNLVQAQGPCPTSNCVSGDIRVTEVMLVQKVGNTYQSMPTSCNTPNQEFNVSLKVKIDVTSQTRYGFLVIGDIYINESPAKAVAQCNPNNFTQGVHEIYVDNYTDGLPIKWKCGQKIELKNVYTAWNNAITSKSNPSICSYLETVTVTIDEQPKTIYNGKLKAGACKAIAPKCRYYGPNESFLIVAPLAPSFSNVSSCGTNNEPYETHTFTSTTTGGFLTQGGSYTYEWYINDVKQASTSNTLIYTPSTGDNFVVRLTVKDQATPTPTTASTDDALNSISPIPCCQSSTAPSSAGKDINNTCPGTEVTLSVSGGSLGTGAAWKWYTGGCGSNSSTLIGTGSSIKVSPAVTTTYYVRAEGDCGSTTCATVTVDVKTNSVKPTGINKEGDGYCANSGSSATLTVDGGTLGTGASWVWYKDGCGTDDAIGTGATIEVNPTVTTTYYVRAEGDCGNSDCASVTVNVVPVLEEPAATVTTQPTCKSNATVAVTSPVNGVTYTLTKGQTTYTAESGIFSGVAPGIYTLTASKSGSCSATGENVTVNDAPSAPDAPDVVVTQHPSCSSSTGTLIVKNSVTGLAYGEGYEFSNDGKTWTDNPSFSFTAGAGYTISVRRVAPNTDCDATATCSGETDQKIATSTTTNTRQQAYDVEIKLDPKAKVVAAPNPYSDKIRFSINSSVSGRGTLELYNLSGQKVKTVFEGHVEKGQLQTIEYMVPGAQRTNLIYVFTVGNERTSGKLIGVKQ